MFVCCECGVLLGRGLCDELITRPEESYRLWCVVVCDLETSRMRRPWPTGGRHAENKLTKYLNDITWDRRLANTVDGKYVVTEQDVNCCRLSVTIMKPVNTIVKANRENLIT